MNTSVNSDIIALLENPTGGILPNNNTHLQMVDANILMEIDVNYGENTFFDFSFDGNYTIYNSNETVEMLIGAPFCTIYFDDLEGIVDNLSIKVDGVSKEYDVIAFFEYNYSLNPWSDYFELYDLRYFALCNVTFNSFTNTTIRYSFDSNFNIWSKTALWISYDVGTSRAWEGVTTEQVEFKVTGQQPDSFSNESLSPTTKFTLSDIENGKSYLWQWESVVIEENAVGISYAFYKHTTKTEGYLFLSTIAVLFMLTKYVFHRKRQKM